MPALKPLVEKRQREGLEAVVSTAPVDRALATAPRRPSYLLLLGDAEMSSDAEPWYVPSVRRAFYRWQEDQPVTFYSDAALGDLDGDLVPDISVGRIPARTPHDVETVVRKILEFEAQPPSERDLRILVWAGEPLLGPTMDRMTTGLLLGVLRDRSPAWAEPWVLSSSRELPFCGWPDDQPTLFIRRMREGGACHTLIGHGTPTSFLGVDYGMGSIEFTSSIASDQLADGRPTPPLILLTCDCGKFTVPDSCLTETLLLLRGGPVAAIGATTQSHPLTNYYTGEGLLAEMTEANARVGDYWLHAQQYAMKANNPIMDRLLRDAEGSLGGKIDVARLRRDQILMYALLGDPATHMRTPQRLTATVERTGATWTWKAQRPANAVRLHVSYRPATPAWPRRPSGTLDREQANAALERANAALAFEPLPAPAADDPWTGTIDRPGTLRLVAVARDRLYVATLKIERSAADSTP